MKNHRRAQFRFNRKELAILFYFLRVMAVKQSIRINKRFYALIHAALREGGMEIKLEVLESGIRRVRQNLTIAGVLEPRRGWLILTAEGRETARHYRDRDEEAQGDGPEWNDWPAEENNRLINGLDRDDC
jgi:hypothetical protein